MTKTMAESTVGQLVVEQPSRSRVFEALGIDYCCGGQKTLEDACVNRGLSVETVLRQIDENDRLDIPTEYDPAAASLAELCDHIEKTHHAYLRQELPRLAQLSEKVANAHGAANPSLINLVNLIVDFSDELYAHMHKEEHILFPLIRRMELAGGPCESHCGSVANPITVMLREHDNAGAALERMRELTHNYTLPGNACNTYRALFDAMQRLELDMHQHVHKENNILFPKAIELEKKGRL